MAGKKPQNRRSSSRERVSVAKLTAAIKAAGGVTGKAAKLVGIHRSTFNLYLQRHPELRDVVYEAREHVSDLAEVGLIRDIEKGKDWRLRWRWLATFARDRGFVEQLEIDETGELRKLQQANRELERRLLQQRRSTTACPASSPKRNGARRWREGYSDGLLLPQR